MKIAVLGSGSWGTAIANLLANKNMEVMVWGRNQAKMEAINTKHMNEKYLPAIQLNQTIIFSDQLAKVIEESSVVIIAVPNQAVRSVLEQAQPFIEDQIIVNVSKGIEIKTLKTVSQIVKEYFDNHFVALSGPSHAEEVAQKIPTTLVSASNDRQSAELIQDLFTTDFLRVYTNPDVIGVEIGGSLKNIIAIGAGISDGLGYGDNAKAALMTRGIREIARLGSALGANKRTFEGLSGIGDLIVTCTSMHSRNRRCGILLGEGKTLEEAMDAVGMVVEGAFTIKSAYKLSKKHKIYMPITEELYKVLYENYDPKSSVKNLMMKRQKHEYEDIVKEEDWN